MKIEVGESLFYSWLRHVKECQIVQTNWKVSPQWELHNEAEVFAAMELIDKSFSEKYGYSIFKQNSSYQQVIKQGECDALGINIDEGTPNYYAVEVAFHGAGLNYGTRETTVAKVIEKMARTAMCLLGFFDARKGDIVFASPKINNAVIADLEPAFETLNSVCTQLGFSYSFRIIANDHFYDSVLEPILLISNNVADTSELFLRSYQLFTMFADDSQITRRKASKRTTESAPRNTPSPTPRRDEKDPYRELKVGQIARKILRDMLISGAASDEEVLLMQDADYSKSVFHLNYPLLARLDREFDKARYYISTPFSIRGTDYVLCSQWFETSANNDRPYLLKWIEDHSPKL